MGSWGLTGDAHAHVILSLLFFAKSGDAGNSCTAKFMQVSALIKNVYFTDFSFVHCPFKILQAEFS